MYGKTQFTIFMLVLRNLPLFPDPVQLGGSQEQGYRKPTVIVIFTPKSNCMHNDQPKLSVVNHSNLCLPSTSAVGVRNTSGVLKQDCVKCKLLQRYIYDTWFEVSSLVVYHVPFVTGFQDLVYCCQNSVLCTVFTFPFLPSSSPFSPAISRTKYSQMAGLVHTLGQDCTMISCYNVGSIMT